MHSMCSTIELWPVLKSLQKKEEPGVNRSSLMNKSSLFKDQGTKWEKEIKGFSHKGGGVKHKGKD